MGMVQVESRAKLAGELLIIMYRNVHVCANVKTPFRTPSGTTCP
jgi:hypothetical protein